MTARRWLAFFSAAAAALAAVLAVVLPLSSAAAQAAFAAGNGVGASHLQMILTVGSSQPVRPVQGGCEPGPRAGFAAGLCVAAEEGQTLFRGTSEGFAGSPGLQAAGVTPATTDPVVGTIFATHAEQFGAGVLHIASPADLAGVKILPGNALSGLEREVAADIPPAEFAARAGTTISAASARSILNDMGYGIPGSIATPGNVQSVLENTGRMSPSEIVDFIARAGG